MQDLCYNGHLDLFFNEIALAKKERVVVTASVMFGLGLSLLVLGAVKENNDLKDAGLCIAVIGFVALIVAVLYYQNFPRESVQVSNPMSHSVVEGVFLHATGAAGGRPASGLEETKEAYK